MVITFRQGIYSLPTAPSVVQGSSPVLWSFVAAPTDPLIVVFGHGSTSYLYDFTSQFNDVWMVPTNTQVWLFIGIDENLDPIFRVTDVQPLSGTQFPASPAYDTYFYSLDTHKQYRWNGNTWEELIAINIADIDASGNVTMNPSGVSLYGDLNNDDIGYPLVIGERLLPITYDADDGKKFLTSVDDLYSKGGEMTTFKGISSTAMTFKCGENIQKGYPVYIKNNKAFVSRNDQDFNEAIGIAAMDAMENEMVTIVNGGAHLYDVYWNYSVPSGTTLWVGKDGAPVTDMPHTGSAQRIGYVLDNNTIVADVKAPIRMI